MLVAVGNGVLKEVSPLCCHALLKFTPLASVPSFAPLGNDVREVQDFHADVKFEQVFMSVVLKSLSDEQPYHARYVFTAEGSSELKLVSEVQLLHALLASPTNESAVLKLVRDVQLYHARNTSVTDVMSPPSN